MKVKTIVTATILTLGFGAQVKATEGNSGWKGATCGQYIDAIQKQDRSTAENLYTTAVEYHMEWLRSTTGTILDNFDKEVTNPEVITGNVMLDGMIGLKIMGSPIKLYESCMSENIPVETRLTYILWSSYSAVSTTESDGENGFTWWNYATSIEKDNQ